MLNLPAPPDFHGLDDPLPLRVYHRHLPHWRQDGATYFVTFRLGDSLPQVKVHELQEMRRQWEAKHVAPRENAEWEEFARNITMKTEHWLDEGYGCCHLRNPLFAKILADALVHFNHERYFTSCYVVMPNHCHVIIKPYPCFELEDILGICKGYVARQVNLSMGQSGSIWQEESFDRIIRDEEHLYRVVQYIGRNPRMAGIERDKWIRWIDPTWQAAGWDFVDD